MPTPAFSPRVGLAVAALLATPLVAHAQPPRRAIVVSYDSFNEQRVTGLLGESLPAFRAMAQGAACTDGARPMFPSLTAASHAAIWTGTWGNANGITGNRVMLPSGDSVTALTTGDGFRFEHLNAEPAWLAFARQGKRVVGLHVTQAPGVPGYPWRADREARRAAAGVALAKSGTWVFNGYNDKLDDARVWTERDLSPRAAGAWRNAPRVPAGAPAPREVSWALGRDSVFAFITGAKGAYDRMWIAVGARDGAKAVEVRAREATPAGATDSLARFFSNVVEVQGQEGRAFARWRLFALAPDASSFVLFQPELNVVSANRSELADAHDKAVRGFVGNGAGFAWQRGRLGRTYREGGDGTAERRYLETVELSVRQSMRAVTWAWAQGKPDALFTYLSVGDGVDHDTWGEAAPAPPVAADTARVRAARAMRRAVWQYADRHLGLLRRLAAQRPGTAVFVSGDHGMRPVYRVLRVHVALANAGLVVLDTVVAKRGARVDTTVRVNLSRSQVVTPAGYWITANTIRRGGPVPVDSAEAVLARAAEALLAVRDDDGQPVVTAIRRPIADDSLGLGGPAGGDRYWDLRAGWSATGETRGPVTGAAREIGGAHGFTSTDDDMQTAFCAWGPGIPAGRHARGRVIDVVPTASEWLRVAPPADAIGASWLPTFLGRRR